MDNFKEMNGSKAARREEKTMRKIFSVLALLILTAVQPVFADEEYPIVHVPPSPEFNSLKQLAGTWEGTATEPDGTSYPAKIIYQVTAAGSALVETIYPGKKHEMLSVYFNKDGKLTMTHYCVIGNRPILVLSESKSGRYFFDLDSAASQIDTAKEPHFHSLKITVLDPNTLRQERTYYEDGKTRWQRVLELKRVS